MTERTPTVTATVITMRRVGGAAINMRRKGLTPRALPYVNEQLSKVDRAVGLVEALVNRLAGLFVELRVDGGQREVARRVADALADVVIVEQHADDAPIEARQDLHHHGANFPASSPFHSKKTREQMQSTASSRVARASILSRRLVFIFTPETIHIEQKFNLPARQRKPHTAKWEIPWRHKWNGKIT